MEPILHLSIPVRDLDESRGFYLDALGCEPGRVRDGWADVFFYGCQLTLQHQPDEVLAADARGVRHFGVTLGADAWRAAIARLHERGVVFLREPATDHAGTPREQTKAMVEDPSGNAIEIKTYRDPGAALSP